MVQAIVATLVLALGVQTSLCGASRDIVTPMLLWSNKAIIGNGAGLQSSYEAVPDAQAFASQLVLGALGQAAQAADQVDLSHLLQLSKASTADAPAVFVYVGHQLDASDIRRRSSGVAGLAGIVASAASSIMLPYAQMAHLDLLEKSVQRAVIEQLEQAGVAHKAIGCGLPDTSLLSAMADVMPDVAAQRMRVVVVCSSVPGDVQDDQSLALELKEVEDIQALVARASVDYMFMLVSIPSGPSTATPVMRDITRGRTLTASSDVYTTCGPLCQTQVAWLQAMLFVLFGALASCSGLLCLYMLDTPTRFATPKDAGVAVS